MRMFTKRRGKISQTKNFKLPTYKNKSYYLNFRHIIWVIKACNCILKFKGLEFMKYDLYFSR